jgi:hypothetical protein
MQSGELQVAVEEGAYGPGLGGRRGTVACSGREEGVVESEPDTNVDRDHLFRSRGADEKRADRRD